LVINTFLVYGEWRIVPYGVPQGSVLGLCCFLSMSMFFH